MAESSYMISPGETPDSMSMRRKLALALAQKNMQTPKIEHWAQGLAHLAEQAYSGYETAKLNRDEKEETARGNALLAQMLGSPATVSAAPIPNAQVSEPQIVPSDQLNSIDAMADLKPETQALLPRAQRSIAGIESAGRYDATGPVIKSGPMAGQRAHGKYQVMESNIGPWTKEILGKEMTPQEFLANQDAQDAVFNGKFGKYADKYGAEGASKAWFAGEGGMNNPNAKDQLGTTVAAYADRFTGGMNDEGALPPNAQPTQAAGNPMANALSPSVPGAPSREMLIQMLGNRKTAPIAQAIISNQIQQKFKPSEYDFKERPDGTLVAVNKKNPSDVHVVNAPGSGQSAIDYEANKAAAIATAKGKAEKSLGAAERRDQEAKVGTIVTQDVDRAIDLIEKNPITTTGVVGPWLSKIGGTPAANVRALVDTVKANAGFAELQKMRNNSPTGGALGQVSEREIAYLQSTIGNMEQSQTADQLKDNLRRVKNAYMDIVHGEGKGPEREKLTFQNKPSGDGWRDMGGGVRIREKR